MNEVKRLICIGSNCIAADVTHFADIRIPSPVDNISGFNIWKSHLLFDKTLSKSLFHEEYEVRPSTAFEREKYFYSNKVYTFNPNFSIVHNDFENKHFQNALKKRIKLFEMYYKLSQKEKTLWYVYCLNFDDDTIDDSFMQEIIKKLPECCINRLLCIGMRGKNTLFEKYFKYYLEFDETQYKWHNRNQAYEILRQFENKYDLKFLTGK